MYIGWGNRMGVWLVDLCGGLTVWVDVMWMCVERVCTGGCDVKLLTVANRMGR
jgi:hypothetical protein